MLVTRRLVIGTVAALVAPLAVALTTAPAAAAPAQNCAHPTFANGLSQNVFSSDSSTWVRGEAWVEVPGVDSDLNGVPDRVHVDITRPAETANGCGYRAPVILEASPYYAGLGNNDTQFCATQPCANWSVDHEIGFPPATRPAGPPFPIRDTSPIISSRYESTWLPRGFAVVHAESLGTGWSTGCSTDGAPNETLGVKAVVDWLTGRGTAYSSVDGDTTLPAPDWSNGHVGMIGTSYNATLAIAAATTGVQGLDAIVPISPVVSYYDYYRENGMVRGPGGFQGEDSDVLTDLVNTRRSAATGWQPDASVCKPVTADISAHIDRASGDYTPFWVERNLMNDIRKVHAPVLIAHGNADDNVQTKQSVMFYEAIKRLGIPHEFYFHRSGHGGAPPDVMVNRWLTRYVFGVHNGVERQPKSWVVRESYACPPRQTTVVGDQSSTDVLTVADSRQLTLGFTPTIPVTAADGSVTPTTRVITDIPDRTHVQLDSPVATGAGERVADGATVALECGPANPTPYPEWPDPSSAPATMRFTAGAPGIGGLTAGPGTAGTETLTDDASILAATSANTASSPVRLLYETPALTHDVRISGTPWLSLWTSFSKPRANLTGALVDYPPSGPGTIITRGWLDPTNRNSPAVTEPITPGQFYRMRFDLAPRDSVIPAGDRIGVMILSSDFEHTIRPAPGTQLTVDLQRSSVQLPVVGGTGTLDQAISAGTAGAQLSDLRSLVDTLDLPQKLANALRHDLDDAQHKLGTKAACQPLGAFLRSTVSAANLDFASAEQLMSVGNVQALLNCVQPGGATVYLPDESYFTATHSGAEVDLLELAETINGMGLDPSITADLSGTARTGATQATDNGRSACPTVAQLTRKISADTGRNGGLTAGQAATLMGPVPRIRGEIGC